MIGRSNGECVYESKRRDGAKELTVEARITPKRIITRLHVFDRDSGRSTNAFTLHKVRVVRYRVAFGEWVTIDPV